MIESFLTPNQVAKMLRIHSSKVREEMDNGNLKCKYFGKHRKTTESWVKEWQYRPDNQTIHTPQNSGNTKIHKQRRSISDVIEYHQKMQLQSNSKN